MEFETATLFVNTDLFFKNVLLVNIHLPCCCTDSQVFWKTRMMTSSNGNFSALLAICAGNSPVPGEFPTQRPVTRSCDVYFDLRPNKRLSKQLWGWWFETQSRPLWRHRNGKSVSMFPNITYSWINESTSFGQWTYFNTADNPVDVLSHCTRVSNWI